MSVPVANNGPMWRILGRSLVAGVLLLLLVQTLSGCVTGSQGRGGAARYTVDGVRYGVTEGRFRGRWWNYYERGRSYLEGGFYDEARADLEVALRNRSKDQLWPRTYGLHFVPEYFPNRELGIVNYQEGDLDGAIRELTLSMEQRYSARGAYYLDRTRLALLEERGGDSEAPRIEDVLTASSAVGEMTYTLTGVARDDQFVSKIVVAGQPVDILVSAPEIPFEVEVPLDAGINEIEIICTDLLGKTTTIITIIEADLDGPLLSFDEPMVLPGTVRGVVYDPSGIAAFEIAGSVVETTPGADDVGVFAVEVSAAQLEASVTFRCEDGLGNVTEGILPADLLVAAGRIPEFLPAGSMKVMTLPTGQRLFLVGNQVVAMTVAAAGANGPTVKLAEIEDGDTYYMDEIVVDLVVASSQPIVDITLNDNPVPTIPGRTKLRISRRVRLPDAVVNSSGEVTPAEFELLCRMRDNDGRSAEDRKVITRGVDEISLTANRLSVALLRRESLELNPDLGRLTDDVLSLLGSNKVVTERFTLVDRDELSRVLAEQKLSALLATKDGKLALGRLIPADMMLTTVVRLDEGSVEILLEGISTETSAKLNDGRIEAAGPIGDIERIVEELAIRLVQAFPRVQGEVFEYVAPDVMFGITLADRIRLNMKAVVFSVEEVRSAKTGKLYGTRQKILAEATINQINDMLSVAAVHAKEVGDDLSTYPIEEGHFVVIK